MDNLGFIGASYGLRYEEKNDWWRTAIKRNGLHSSPLSSSLPMYCRPHLDCRVPGRYESCSAWRGQKRWSVMSLPETIHVLAHFLLISSNMAKSIIRVTSPGTYLIRNACKAAGKLSRQCNSFAADLTQRGSSRRGLSAMVPRPTSLKALKRRPMALTNFLLVSEVATTITLVTEVLILSSGFVELHCRKPILFIHPISSAWLAHWPIFHGTSVSAR